MTEDGSTARGWIGVMLAGALFTIILAMIFFAPRPEVKDYLTLLIGALIANVTAVIQFYFGSSSGAKQLVATQGEIVKAAVNGTGSGLTQTGAPTGKADDPVAVTEVKPVDIDTTVPQSEIEKAIATLRASRKT